MFKKIFSRATVHLAKHTNFPTQYPVGSGNHFRQIHCGVCLRNPRYTSKPTGATSPAISGKYQVITDDNSPIIEHTVDEIHSQPLQDKYPILSDEYDGINLESKFSLRYNDILCIIPLCQQGHNLCIILKRFHD